MYSAEKPRTRLVPRPAGLLVANVRNLTRTGRRLSPASFDSVGRLASISLKSNSGGVRDSAAYGCNLAGLRIAFTNAGGTYAAFQYDGKMRRRVRSEYTWSGSAWTKTNIVRYIYDGSLVIQERFFAPQLSTNTPQQTVSYTRGLDLSGSLEGAGGIGGLLARFDHSALNPQLSTAVYHSDGNGNITCLVNPSFARVARYSYDSYGNILGQSGPLADANLYRFSSKEAHPNSGLVYYLYRFYEPCLQRWLNSDPLGEAGGFNLYRFADNTPVSQFDGFGLAPPNHPHGPPIPPHPFPTNPRSSPRQRCEASGGAYMLRYEAPPYSGSLSACTKANAPTWPGFVCGAIGAIGGTLIGKSPGAGEVGKDLGGIIGGAIGTVVGGASACLDYVCVVGGTAEPAQ